MLGGAPALGQLPLDDLTIRLHAVKRRIPQREWVMLARGFTVRRVDQPSPVLRGQQRPRLLAQQRSRRIDPALDPWKTPGVHPLVPAFPDDRGHRAVHDRNSGQMGDDQAPLGAVQEPSESRNRLLEDSSGS
jgi:hypothetical protein